MSINLNKLSKDSYFMNLALIQARKVLGNTKKNHAVGCVIVKDNCLLSAASTRLNGYPHAEHNALIFNKEKNQNCDLYVTLEPCSNYGKTPPCVKTIIKNKIGRVFFSIKDPDLKSFNKSSLQFKKNRIKVKTGINHNQINHFYRSYKKSKRENLPFVTCKLAISKDFYTVNKKRRWITNEFSRGRVHIMRSEHDCLITSSRTIIKDNSTLNCRIKGLENKSPSRIILDSKLKIPLTSNLIKTSNLYKTIIFYHHTNTKKIRLLKKLNIRVIRFPIMSNGFFDLREILTKVKKLGYSRVMVETGIKLSSNFLKFNLVDDLHLFISNKKIKKDGDAKMYNYYKHFLLKNRKKNLIKVNLLGDKLITYNLK